MKKNNYQVETRTTVVPIINVSLVVVLTLMMILAMGFVWGCQQKAQEVPLEEPKADENVGMPALPTTIMVPEDIAGAILMMASDHTGFVTGTYTPVCGGIQME